MVAGLIVFALGVIVGAATGTVLGALVGGIVGMLLGGLVHGLLWTRSRLRENVPTVEAHSVMCFPYAQSAECEFVGDLESGRWVDVKRCSLLRDPNHVNCDKGCIRLMNVTSVRPGEAHRRDVSAPAA